MTGGGPWTGPRIGWKHTPSGRGGREGVRRGIAEREAALAKVPLFAELPKRHLRALASSSGVTDYDEGETVVKQGAAGNVFYVILEGQARVVRNGRRVATVAPSGFFGEMSLLDGAPRTASVVTDEPSRLISLPRKVFQDLLAESPTVSKAVLSIMARRLRTLERPPAG